MKSIKHSITILQSKLQKYYNKYNKGNLNKVNDETNQIQKFNYHTKYGRKVCGGYFLGIFNIFILLM